jgi:signal transduction histidine kinase
MKRNILFCIALLLVIKVNSQRRIIDSLHQNNKEQASFSWNNQIAIAYLYVSPDSAIIYGNKALLLAEKEKNPKYLADVLTSVGVAYDYLNKQAFALDYFLRSLSISESIKDEQAIADANYYIADLFNGLRELKTSRVYYFNALRIYEKLGKQIDVASIYSSLGNNYFKAKMYDSSIHYNRKAVALSRKLGDRDLTLMMALSGLADDYIYLGKEQEALPYIEEAEKIAIATGDDYYYAYCSMQKGFVAMAIGENEKAFDYAKETIKVGEKMKMDDLIMYANELLYKLYKKWKKPELALAYYEKYTEQIDTLLTKRKYKAVDSLLTTYRLEKKDKELELLQNQNQLKKAYLIGAISAALLMLIVIVLLVNSVKEKRKTVEALEIHNKIIELQKDQIEQQAEYLDNINQVKDRIFSIISHDLRGPISSLKGLMDYMKSNSLSGEESALIVKELQQSTQSIDMLLENLLVWAQMQIRGDVYTEPININLHQAVSEVYDLYYPIANQKDINLINDIPNNLNLQFDKNHLFLVLRNLVSNAIKFTNNGGFVKLRASLTTTLKICVEDSGIGISEAETKKLFDVNTLFTKRGTNNERGTGLGLLFVKDYIEKNEGVLSISSTEGIGTVFCITLPISKITNS